MRPMSFGAAPDPYKATGTHTPNTVLLFPLLLKQRLDQGRQVAMDLYDDAIQNPEQTPSPQLGTCPGITPEPPEDYYAGIHTHTNAHDDI